MNEEQETPTIRLDHFLQVCGVETGGQAKRLIQSGLVTVNDEVETRRRKKLVSGDLIGIDGEVFEVRTEEEPDDFEESLLDDPGIVDEFEDNNLPNE